jgi:hypothetical protein
MLGADHTVSGDEAVLDVGEHRVRPAEGRVAGRGATGAGDVALVDDTRLLDDAAKPLTAVADHRGSGRDAGAQRLVSPARNPRTTWRRACSGRPSSDVSIAAMKGVCPRRPRPDPSPERSPPR